MCREDMEHNLQLVCCAQHRWMQIRTRNKSDWWNKKKWVGYLYVNLYWAQKNVSLISRKVLQPFTGITGRKKYISDHFWSKECYCIRQQGNKPLKITEITDNSLTAYVIVLVEYFLYSFKGVIAFFSSLWPICGLSYRLFMLVVKRKKNKSDTKTLLRIFWGIVTVKIVVIVTVKTVKISNLGEKVCFYMGGRPSCKSWYFLFPSGNHSLALLYQHDKAF